MTSLSVFPMLRWFANMFVCVPVFRAAFKHQIATVAIVGSCALMLALPIGRSAAAQVLEDVPPRDLSSMSFLARDNIPVLLSSYRGAPLLINFWATWCSPCREELPGLVKLQERLNELTRDPSKPIRVRVLLISLDAAGQFFAQSFLKSQLGIDHPTLGDPQLRTRDSVGFRGLPHTILVDQNGIQVAERVGPARWDQAGVAEEILTRLAGDLTQNP